jgi:hypothetical protein
MPRQRRLPAGLKAQAEGRTDKSVEALRSTMKAIKARLDENDYAMDEPLTIKAVQEKAGLNPKFLYGQKHKATTKAEVEAFVDKINVEWQKRQRESGVPTEIDLARQEAAYWKERYDRLATNAALWWAKMRQKDKRIADLEVIVDDLRKKSAKVVSLVEV